MSAVEPIYLPALKGRLGIRFYYLALMPLGTVARIVKVGEEIYATKKLSAMIQRELRGYRSKDIAGYLRGVDERFFNAMVVGVYGGEPDWEPFRITAGETTADVTALSLDTVNSFGFLKLRGDERLFPLDGQHRLAGIRMALAEEPGGEASDLAKEEVAVLFVAHEFQTEVGRERSRRLFTILNKKAKPVDFNEIIALDEDDVMAIACRWLVENYPRLMDDRVWYTASPNIPATGSACLTTIGTLYHVLSTLFLAASGRSLDELRNNRPTDEWLSYYFHAARTFFDAIAERVPTFARYTSEKDFGRIAQAQRGPGGGHMLFRPAGLRAFAEVVADIVEDEDLPQAEARLVSPLTAKRKAGAAIKAAVAAVAKLPLKLDQSPHAGVLWNPETHLVQSGKRTLDRDLMLDMLGRYPRREALRVRYAKAIGKEGVRVRLPSELATKRARAKASG